MNPPACALALCAALIASAACHQRKSAPDDPPAPSPEAGTRSVAATPATAPVIALPAAAPLPRVPAGLPIPPESKTAISAEIVALGQLLFAEPRLAADRQTSCASCHIATEGYSGERTPTALARPNLRRAPPLINLAWQREFGWDGRFTSLPEQISGHLHGQLGAPAEIAIAAVAADPTIRAHFSRAFPADPETEPNGRDLITALSAFVGTRYSGGSPWDALERAAGPGDPRKAGYQLFISTAQCSVCHPPPLYTDLGYHRLGLIASADEGRGRVDPALRGAFKTPTLRGASARRAFFHDASAATLEAAVDWHLAGGTGQGADRSIIDPALVPIPLSATQRAQLLAFLSALTPEP